MNARPLIAGVVGVVMLLVAAIVPAAADTFEDGSINATESVTASSITLTATGGSVYSFTSSSGIHVREGKVKLDSGALIQWADGSISTSANSSSSFWSNYASTFTRFENEFSTANSTWTSVPGSTVTLSMSGRRALAAFTCSVRRVNATSGSPAVGLGLLVDGTLVDGQHQPTGETLGGLNRSRAEQPEMGGFAHLTVNTYSGSTAFSVIMAAKDATAVLNENSASVCQFLVTEQ